MKPKTWTHPKFSLLQRRLRICPALAAGILEGIWHLAATFDPEGGKLPYTDDELAAWLGVDLAADELLAALVDGRWIDDAEEGLRVHDWEDHKPSYIRDAERKRNYRANVSRDNPGTVQDNPGTVQDNPCAAVPSDSDSDSVCKTEVSNDTSSQQPAAAGISDGSKIFVLPLAGGGCFRLTAERVAEYRAAYSWDVPSEIAKAALWLKDNPDRRPKTHRSVQSFVTRWLNRRDDKERQGGPRGESGGMSADEYKRDLERRTRKTREYVTGCNGKGGAK